PVSTACLARLRVRKKRAAHSHTSTRTDCIGVSLSPIRVLPGRWPAIFRNHPQPAPVRGKAGWTIMPQPCRLPHRRKRSNANGRLSAAVAGAPGWLDSAGGLLLGLGLGDGGQVFLDAGSLAFQATQVVQLAGADLAAALDLDRVDDRAEGLEHALDAVAVRDLAHGERGVQAGVLGGDDQERRPELLVH